MIITGIADEAGFSLDAQIKAHKELNWQFMELRLINGKNIAGELSDEEFEKAFMRIDKANMRVSAFASAIGNWSRSICGDFNLDVGDLKSSIPRMKRFGTKYIRIMSWVGDGLSENEWRKETIRRCRELAKIAEDAGIVLLHENCTGWGGLGAKQMLELLHQTDSPALKLLYDIGNTVSHGYEPKEFFDVIRNNFAYIHIKDVFKNPEGGPSSKYALCGAGDAMIEEILNKTINDDAYDGFISIEPHVAAIVHLEGSQVPEKEKYGSYIKYAKKLLGIIERIQEDE
jgi:sugar phosphate isomerase/epimerase